MKKVLMASVVAGIIMFFWGFVSWTVLSWHQDVSHRFSDEAAMEASIKAQAPEAGIYFLPFEEEGFKEGGASMFASIVPEYHLNMPVTLGVGLLCYIISAFLVVVALRMTHGLSYGQRLGYICLLGLIIGFVGHFPYWNWMNFSTPYVLVMIIDSVISWLLAGLVIAKWIEGSQADE